ncbi:hypothetical protein [Chachezhania antarctica]|uniref:hypothetical protein n=1 Tax=Chachezhania antarctica TaxID=2340860 RepID=UPI000EB59E92|nr:hypothetical protein [Chachezhania antarctica]
MSCPCDTCQPIGVPDIPPGLTALPRTIGRFDDFRASMWAARRDHPALRDWSGQAPGDLGAMLVDFWAVVCDIGAFYDEVRANEAYIGTAPSDLHLRRLIGTLGYRPKPATAASAWIALEVSGARSRTLPAGAAFRSGPVGDGPPQVFETGADAVLHPAFSALPLGAPAPSTLAAAQGLQGLATVPGLWIEPRTLGVRPGDIVIVEAGSALHITRLQATREETFADGRKLLELTFATPVPVDPESLAPGDVTLWTPGQSGRLWSQTAISGDHDAMTSTSVVLSTLSGQIAPGDIVSLTGGDGSLAVTRAATAREVGMTVVAAGSTTATDEDDESYTIETPAVRAPSTRVTWSGALSVGGSSADVVVGFAMRQAGQLASPPQDTARIGAGSVLPIEGAWRYRRRWPVAEPRQITALISDPQGNGAAVSAEVDPATATLTLGGEAETHDLTAPVTAHGNAVKVTRGETVAGEVLGQGNGAVPHQSFELKKPLTYLPAPSEAGYVPALEVRVDGILASEVSSFYGQPAEALVYTLRETEDGKTLVTFGDGIHGARLVTGALVTADYRTGAGADAPGPDSLTQMVTADAEVTTVHQPFAAWGGSDAESPDLLRRNAPRSALLLGRAISLADFEAAALTQDGVQAAEATWTWSKRRQRPVVQIRFAGDAALAPALTARVRALSDPSVPLDIAAAAPVPVRLALQVAIEPDHRSADVLAALREALTLPRNARFCLSLPRIGAAFFRSALASEALAVPGVNAVTAITWADGHPPDPEGEACPKGHWFTVDPDLGGSLVLNGEEAAA